MRLLKRRAKPIVTQGTSRRTVGSTCPRSNELGLSLRVSLRTFVRSVSQRTLSSSRNVSRRNISENVSRTTLMQRFYTSPRLSLSHPLSTFDCISSSIIGEQRSGSICCRRGNGYRYDLRAEIGMRYVQSHLGYINDFDLYVRRVRFSFLISFLLCCDLEASLRDHTTERPIVLSTTILINRKRGHIHSEIGRAHV